VLYIMDEAAHLTAFTVPAPVAAVPAIPKVGLWLAAASLMLLGLFAARGRTRASEGRAFGAKISS